MPPLHILILTGGDFTLNEEHLARIRQVLPDSVIRHLTREQATREEVHEAHVIFGIPRQKDWVLDAPALRWLHLPWAGADGWTGLRHDVLLTNSSGVFGIPVAEWVLGAMLMLTRNLHLYRDQQREARWQERPGAKELHGSTVGIVGLGDIGREVALRARAVGCRVLGARRRTGLPTPWVDAVLPLDELLPEVDFLVLALPGTAETRGLIGRERLARMRPGAYLVNVGRGSLVDEGDLVEALESGHLGGAALDVTQVEPLPPDSRLWQLAQVIISPHTAGRSPEANAARRTEIFCENLRRLAGERPLMNLVDRSLGY